MKKRSELLPYEKAVSQFLFVYRFFAFAIAVVILQVLPLGTSDPASVKVYTLLSIVGVYSMLRYFFPFRFQKRGNPAFLIVSLDLVLCIVLLLFTGGLDSGFLLYSLIPIISASLLFEQKIALTVSAVLCSFLTIAHLGITQFNDSFEWILEGNYLILFIIYVIVCFLISTLAYRTNLNVYRHIERESILEERRRIGREIHDSIAQSLAYLKLKTTLTRDSLSSGNTEKAIGGLDDMKKVAEDAYQDVREIIDSLSTETEEINLIPSLIEYIRIFQKRTGIKTDFLPPDVSVRLSPLAELQLLRIAQESLANVRKHARAGNASIEINIAPKVWEMVIKDDGLGISPDKQSEDSHHGLKIMRERAGSIGAVLSVETSPELGTKIIVRMPR